MCEEGIEQIGTPNEIYDRLTCVHVAFLSFEDLKQNKQESDHAKDIADLGQL